MDTDRADPIQVNTGPEFLIPIPIFLPYRGRLLGENRTEFNHLNIV